MNRRTFSKVTSLTFIGSGLMAAFPSLATNFKAKSKLRLGGPLFEKFDSPETWVAAVKNTGYRAAYCPVGLDAGKDDIKAYKKAADKADILIAEVGAWSNPISPDKKTAKEAFEKCVASLDLADQIEAKCCVNIAGSRDAEIWAGPHQENFSDDTFDMIVETTRKIIDQVKPKNTFYSLEAMPWIFPESADSYLRLIKAIDRKAFAVHLDPVNMVTSPALFFRNGDMIKDCFKKLGPYIKSCHAKDLILKKQTFMPQFDEVQPGLGQMDYKVFLSELSLFPEVPLMMEHLQTAEQYKAGAEYILGVEKEIS
ncbi:sugar phosphate isomerase/epimerase family protein [Aquiflexum gelatinilyticum]|uniref:sugar phosphate isomerase/epimerase family protein n=1 Tax=Aquiflexum gelatinilyticum TaxID=2961943 RepID=UPI0021680E5C|nr:sugar phosphate isomerase/epimerase [Aquiflexum gelatinilyticum]MCS4436486.1 sugar phosphate isomerase/epimerase [Aquiflexum gelatinilyticum]